MMKKQLRLLLLLPLLLVSTAAHAQTGRWQVYAAYSNPTEAQTVGHLTYVVASGGLYIYNSADQSLRTFDKAGLLNDCDIAHIIYNKVARKLVIVYSNQNIDLLDEADNVTNISAYANASLTADKTVYGLFSQNESTYLCTGFGMLRLNVAKAEVTATYNLGFQVDYGYVKEGHIYAASAKEGLYRAPLTANLLDKAVWQRVGDYVAPAPSISAELLEQLRQLQPGGPQTNDFYRIKYASGHLYTVGGGFNYLTDYGTPGMVQVMDVANGAWTSFDTTTPSEAGIPFVASLDLALDPTREQHVVVGARSGLFEFDNATLTHARNSTNSPLTTAVNERYTIVPTVAFDAKGSLWLLNCYSPDRNLFEIKPSGEWVSHFQPDLMDGDHSLYFMRGAFFDSRGLLWFVNDHWSIPSLICYDPQTDKAKVIRRFVTTDGNSLGVTYVRCVTEDRQGHLWVGTNVGPLVLTADAIGQEEPLFEQIKVPRPDGSGLADYLLSGVDITAIAVDEANRKWLSTNGNGVYLIDNDNITELHHFTRTGSALLSNNISDIAIDATDGRVYFATDRGLCSYRSDVSQPADQLKASEVYAYPNPGRPDYSGPITVKGLTADAQVKIVTTSGRLVYEGRSNGGSFTWNGLDRHGRRVATGVYGVLVSTADGHRGVVCKIAVVR